MLKLTKARDSYRRRVLGFNKLFNNSAGDKISPHFQDLYANKKQRVIMTVAST